MIVASTENEKSPRVSSPCSLRIAAEFVGATKLECRQRECWIDVQSTAK